MLRKPLKTCLVLGVLLLVSSISYSKTVEIVSKSVNGSVGDSHSSLNSYSGDGKYLVFSSGASNIVENDTNSLSDIFFLDTSTGIVERVSLTNSGGQANWLSYGSTISSDGRYVAFMSRASNFVPNDVFASEDIFVRDILSGTTELISRNNSGVPAGQSDITPQISADGRYVAFASNSSSIITNDINGQEKDIFVHDRMTGNIDLVDVDSNGVQGNASAGYDYDISGDGRYVVFDSSSSNLVINDTNNQSDIFLHDRVLGTTEIITKNNFDVLANYSSRGAKISVDGNFVVFSSSATNLVATDENPDEDIFLYDRINGQIELISVNNDGVQADSQCNMPVVSSDGRFVAFASQAANLAPNDTNESVDIFIRDRKFNKTYPVSINTSGEYGNASSLLPSISADGRIVGFSSNASNLVLNDDNGFQDAFSGDWTSDSDYDSFTNFDDCDDDDTSINPGASEIGYNDIDENCNGIADDDDVDSDGYLLATDCNDNVAAISPGANEIPYNGVDENCNGMVDDTDYDGDGYNSTVDCNDNNMIVYPGAVEVPYNRIDDNCNGPEDDDDLDHDGYVIATDCNDANGTINPGATEYAYNGIDENCNGPADDDDRDHDGYGIATDCNDNASTINPGATESAYNGIDDNCNGLADDDDLDHDSYGIAVDCNDNSSTINPNVYEIFNNGIDENCNGMTDDADATVMVDSTTDTVQQLPVEALLPPDSTGSTTDTTVAENRIGALQNMIAVVSDKLATLNNSMTGSEKLTVYNDCLVDLNAILYKTDGFYGGNPANDWVTTQAGQALLYPQIQNTISFVQGEISKLTTP